MKLPREVFFFWFCCRSLLHDFLDHSLIDRIPGRQNDRKKRFLGS
ncbi:regulatory-associated protein of TOR 2 isoform X1 [Iris pallida]|uniref:Regulatory-associated protein of TOR 2 isoform X1 n=1 Tax=Iris pallida TaxID=29817 RepID=A0AAX6GLV5_IRIPA|nr:regulatory-associated protein of TOR 2 isoform X1 [Iris pallida]